MLLLLAFSAHGQTHVYERYAKLSNLEVAYLKNFPVDSNTHVNITIIIAKNKIAWRWLLKDLNLPTLTYNERKQIRKGKTVVGNILYNHDQTHRLKDPNSTSKYYFSITYNTHNIICYHISSQDEYSAILYHSLKNIINEKD